MQVRPLARVVVALAALAAAAAAIEPTSPPLSQDEILGRWAAALGGRERLAALRTVHLVAQLEVGGLKGSLETWDNAAGQHRDRTEIPGVLLQENVFDGHRGWVRDPSGKVHELSGSDLEDLVSAAHQASYACLVPGRLAGEVKLSGENPESTAYLLAVHPESGKPYEVQLDKKTFLPSRTAQPEQDHTTTQIFSDWREVGGVLFPWHIRQSSGDPKFDLELSVERIEPDTVFDPLLFTEPKETAAATRFSSGSGGAEIPFDLYGVHIFVPVTIDGKGPVPFIFDTGADASAIVQERARELGLAFKGTVEGGGSGGSAAMGMMADVTLGLPGVEVPTRVLYAFPEADHSAVFGTQIGGVLGYDVISRFVVRIDYGRKILTLLDPSTFHYGGAGTVFPITFSGNTISIPGTIEIAGQPPVEIPFAIDTGSGETILLNAPFVDAHHLLATIGDTIPGSGHGLGGRSIARIGRLASVRFGPYSIPRPIVKLSRDSAGSDANPNRAANVGGQLLERFVVYLDYAGKRLILEPNEHLGDGSEYDMSGLELIARGADLATVTVDAVAEGSPAMRAGIRPGDVLTGIDGVSASRFRLVEIERLLRDRERTVALRIERAGRPLEVSLGLRRRI